MAWLSNIQYKHLEKVPALTNSWFGLPFIKDKQVIVSQVVASDFLYSKRKIGVNCENAGHLIWCLMKQDPAGPLWRTLVILVSCTVVWRLAC